MHECIYIYIYIYIYMFIYVYIHIFVCSYHFSIASYGGPVSCTFIYLNVMEYPRARAKGSDKKDERLHTATSEVVC